MQSTNVGGSKGTRPANPCSAPFVSLKSRVARPIAAAALVTMAVIAAGCSGSPAGPGGVLTAGRRVQDGGAGGTICVRTNCVLAKGNVVITAAGGSLAGGTSVELGDDLTTFRFTSTLTGRGRFVSGYIDLRVNGDSADVDNLWFSNGVQTFQDKGKTVPATVVTGEKCQIEKSDTPGTSVTTTITATFENFGPTTIVETHCVPTL